MANDRVSGALALHWDPARFIFDLDVDEDAERFVTDDGLETAINISLFTDRRATPAELQAAGLKPEENRGWPGDSYAEIDGDRWGSLLWLLERAARNDDTLSRAVQYAEDALQWLIDDEVAKTVAASAAWLGNHGYLELAIDITRADGTRWRRVWNATTGELLSDT